MNDEFYKIYHSSFIIYHYENGQQLHGCLTVFIIRPLMP
jgi:hypothetical protein